MSKRWPEAGYGPKATPPVFKSDASIVRPSQPMLTHQAEVFPFQEFTNLFADSDSDITLFGEACIQTQQPIPQHLWLSATTKERYRLMARCKYLAQTGRNRHEKWRRLWATYLAKILTR